MEQPRIVAFVDVGNSKSTVTIGRFESVGGKIKAEVLMHHSDRNLGGRDLDYLLGRQIADEFKEENDLDPMKPPKVRLNLLTEIERVRKALSMDLQADLNIDSLMDDLDLERELTREELEEFIKPVTE